MSYSTSFEKAFALHQDGQPQEAVDAYLTILTAKPENEAINSTLAKRCAVWDTRRKAKPNIAK